jgi:hypothetical protein
LQYRVQFAERFPTEDEVSNAIGHFPLLASHRLVRAALASEQAWLWFGWRIFARSRFLNI